MAQTKDGGPAFPLLDTSDENHYARGMSLRDYFAAEASRDAVSILCESDDSQWQQVSAANMAKAAYFFADAMLAERAK